MPRESVPVADSRQLGDCHDLRCTHDWYPQANNITLSKYAFELPELFRYEDIKKVHPKFEMGIFGHSPDTANEWDFYPIPWTDRSVSVRLFGYDGPRECDHVCDH